jgi:transcriptional regulator with XRE-family HTH domain
MTELTQSPVPTEIDRPDPGWLKATRLGLGLGLRGVAERLDVSPQAVHQFEKSETAGTISLRQLDNVARAMGCRVVYALVPTKPARPAPAARGTVITRAAPAAPASAAEPVPVEPRSLEHSMLLENLAADRFD